MAAVVPCASLGKRLLLVSPSGFGKASVASTLYATHTMTADTIRSPLSLEKCIVLDIEGTTTPISFVFEVLFPYARDNVRKHLIATYDTDEMKDDIKLLRAQVEDDLKQGLNGAVPIPPDEAGKDSVIDAMVPNVEAMIKADRKIPSLEQLQGHIWRTGFESKEIQGVVFDDVPEALKRWHTSGIKVYIYSSGSREAQRLIFGNTTYGDLRPYLCGFFDMMIGNKRESKSYYEIAQSLGVDKPSEVLFITDIYPEAVAAKSAGNHETEAKCGPQGTKCGSQVSQGRKSKNAAKFPESKCGSQSTKCGPQFVLYLEIFQPVLRTRKAREGLRLAVNQVRAAVYSFCQKR